MSLDISLETQEILAQNAKAQGLEIEAYLRWLMAANRDEFVASVEEGLRDVDARRLQPTREALASLGTKLVLPR